MDRISDPVRMEHPTLREVASQAAWISALTEAANDTEADPRRAWGTPHLHPVRPDRSTPSGHGMRDRRSGCEGMVAPAPASPTWRSCRLIPTGLRPGRSHPAGAADRCR
jgi:hypothetical protein